MTGKLTVVIGDCKPMRSNSSYCFVDLVIPELRLRIREAAVHTSHGRRWVGLPAESQVGRDGQVKRDDRSKIAYSPVLQSLDRDVSDAFSQRGIAAPIEAFPHAFDGDGR
jgi:hypothetical protein